MIRNDVRGKLTSRFAATGDFRYNFRRKFFLPSKHLRP